MTHNTLFQITKIKPALFRLQQLAVGCYLGVELYLDVHQVSVLHQLVINGLPQSLNLIVHRISLDIVVLTLLTKLVLQVTNSTLVVLVLKFHK